MKLPNLNHLSYLLMLHEEQHFNRAAKRCFISQSTLSAAIQNLEEQCGNQILERDNKHFVFTSFGLALVERAQKLVEDAQDFTQFAETGGDWRKSVLRMGVIPTIAPFIFNDLLTSAKEQYPELQLLLSEDTSANVMADLMSGKLDVVLLALPFATPNCRQRILGHDPFHLVGHPEQIANLPQPFEYSRLPKDSVYLLQAEHCMTDHAVSACEIAYQEQVNALSASSIHTLLQMSQHHQGFTFIPDLAKRQGILNNTGLTTLPSDGDAYREIALVWRNTSQRADLFNSIASILIPLMPVPNI